MLDCNIQQVSFPAVTNASGNSLEDDVFILCVGSECLRPPCRGRFCVDSAHSCGPGSTEIRPGLGAWEIFRRLPTAVCLKYLDPNSQRFGSYHISWGWGTFKTWTSGGHFSWSHDTVVMCYAGWFEFVEEEEQSNTADSGRLEKKPTSLFLITSHEH